MATSTDYNGSKRKLDDDEADTKAHIRASPPYLPTPPPTQNDGCVARPGEQEELPKLAAFDPRRAKYRPLALTTVDKLFNLIAPLAAHDGRLQNIVNHTEQWVMHREKLDPIKPKIGMAGGSGTGKSSSLNSIMDEIGMARAGADGDACSNIPIYYIEGIPEQTLTYAVKIVYMKLKKVRGVLRTQVDNYYTFYFEKNPDWDGPTTTEFGNRADTARDFFYDVFGNKAECSSLGAVASFLKENYKAGTDVVDKMMSWVKGIYKTMETMDGAPFLVRQSDSRADLDAEVLELTSSNHSEDAVSLWPLVTAAFVGDRNSDILKYGDFLDLPGVTDTNRLRADMTEKHVSSCTALVTVADVKRANDNPETDKIIGLYARRFPSSLALVVTCSDTGLDSNLARDMPRKGHSIGDYHELCRERADLVAEKKVVGKAVMTRPTADITTRLLFINARILAIDRLCNLCLNEARTDHIKAKISADKNKHLPDGHKLKVFDVANNWYSHMISPGSVTTISDDYVVEPADSGVPRLRSWLRGLAAPGITQADDRLILGKIPDFVGGLQTYVDHSPAKQLEVLLRVVDVWPAMWEELVNAAERETSQMFEDEFLKKMKKEMPASLRAAQQVVKTVCSRNGSAVIAFFNKDGAHETGTVSYECWNLLLLDHQIEHVVNATWAVVGRRQSVAFDACVQKMIMEVKKVPEKLASNPAGMAIPDSFFANIIEPQIVEIESAHNIARQVYEAEIDNIRIRSTTDRESAFFTQAMAPCYAAGRADKKGRGLGARLKESFGTFVLGDAAPFEKAAEMTDEAVQRTLHVQTARLHKPVDDILNGIVHKMKRRMQQADTTETSKETAIRMEVKKLLHPFANQFAEIKKAHEDTKRDYLLIG
ncbi:hypothetical protein B0A48_14166 [Cryoendolithus antarcticus]|uniref:DUF7605 domain-containing protein n=1 Tax=Cryoendolithus antarcticus TaxID=1507870 RepID=A0A1V8SM54_9PEZI|nr:hypothetical protein B0A48_14166 [Cryoendolithus antarcticus]